MIEDIFILGATGNIGKTLVRQVEENGDTDFNRHVNPTRIVGLASSSKYVYSDSGISKEDIENFPIGKGDGFTNYENLDDILSNVRQTYRGGNSNLVFVDVTAANGPMTEFHKKIISHTNYGIVTANKNPLAFSDFDTFKKLTADTVRYGYMSTVMAGAGAVSMMQDLNDLSDAPTSISGCFSGTLGYINSELDKKRKLSEIITEAYEKGYTEPHPKDDLNGLDVARKLLILTRTAGYSVEMSDIELKPFVNNDYLCFGGVKDFLKNLQDLDEPFSKWVSDLDKKNEVLRYVAEMNVEYGEPKLKVGFQEVPRNSPLGSLEGTTNKMVVVTSNYPKGSEYIIEAPGAGLDITAQNVRRNLLYQLVGRKNLI